MLVAALLLCWPGAGAPRSHSGRAGDFDFYLLTLSWSPEYCHGRPDDPQCTGSRHFGFVVHGLWPQYRNGGWPEFCSHAPGLVNPAEMLDIMPSLSLIDHEWLRHGTCSGLDANAYFGLARKAFTRIRIPSGFIRPAEIFTVGADDLLQQFVQANPGLNRGAVAVSCHSHYLNAVEICIDRNLQPVTCTAVRSCHDPALRVPPVR